MRHGIFFILSVFLLGVSEAPLYAGAYFLELTQSGAKVTRKWKTPHAVWRLNASGAPANVQTVIQSAFDMWANESLSTVSNEYAGITDNEMPKLDGYSDIIFSSRFAELGISGDIIALTFRNAVINESLKSAGDAEIGEADIMINLAAGSFQTEVATDPADLDIWEIVGHEIGHLYGLAHTFLIDALMYPSKPKSNTSAEIKALYRVPKRSLAQDDIAWISSLYPAKNFASETATIAGRVMYDNNAYIGAHVIAIRTEASDNRFIFATDTQTNIDSLIVKGMSTVSAFSEQKGKFVIKGLVPGHYKVIVQDSNNFLKFGLDNVNAYLGVYGSSNVFPLEILNETDCANGSIVTSDNINELYSNAYSVDLSAGIGLCDVQVQARTGGDICGEKTLPEEGSCSSGGGGCQLEPEAAEEGFNLKNHPGIILMLVGGFVILVLSRRSSKKSRDREARRPKSKDWL